MPPLDTIEDSTADTERPVFQIARRWLQSKNRHERSISSHLRVVPNSYHHVLYARGRFLGAIPFRFKGQSNRNAPSVIERGPDAQNPDMGSASRTRPAPLVGEIGLGGNETLLGDQRRRLRAKDGFVVRLKIGPDHQESQEDISPTNEHPPASFRDFKSTGCQR